MVAPARSGLENETIDFNVSGDIRSLQPVNSAQENETMQSPYSDQQITRSIAVSCLERTIVIFHNWKTGYISQLIAYM